MAKHVLLPIDIQHEESWKVALPMARRLMDAGDVLHLLGDRA